MWNMSKRRLRERQKFSSMRGALKVTLVKTCARRRLNSARPASKINSIFVESSKPLGVTEEALRRSAGVLQCRSPVKGAASEMQRLNLREIELEAELAGIDMELGARGFGSRMHDGGAGDEFFFDSDVVSKDEIGTQGNRTPVALAVATTVEGATETRGKRLQPPSSCPS